MVDSERFRASKFRQTGRKVKQMTTVVETIRGFSGQQASADSDTASQGRQATPTVRTRQVCICENPVMTAITIIYSSMFAYFVISYEIEKLVDGALIVLC